MQAAVVASEHAAKRTEELGQAKSALAVLTSENHRHEKLLAKEKDKAAKAKEGLKGSAVERGELEAKLVAAAAAAAAKEARAGADATAKIDKARAGRASYISADNLIGHNDPGAEAAYEAIRNQYTDTSQAVQATLALGRMAMAAKDTAKAKKLFTDVSENKVSPFWASVANELLGQRGQ